MEKERRIKTISVIALIVAVLGLTVAFAVLSANLVINGTAKVDPGKWDIRFEELSDAKTKGGATVEGNAIINPDNKTMIKDINVTLTKPMDEVTYTVDLINEGTIDAEISDITEPQMNDDAKNYVAFSATYADKKEITKGDILKASKTEKITISIKFKEEVTKLPDDNINITLSYEINYVQTDKKAEDNVHNGEAIESAPQINYENLKQGSEVKLGNEEFYVIENNNAELKLLAKYSLLVGDMLTFKSFDVDNPLDPNNVTITPIDESKSGYGRQSSEAVMYTPDRLTWMGAVAFAKYGEERKISNCLTHEGVDCYYGYWIDITSENLLTKYGNTYPANVYDEQSNLYKYVENYRKYLTNELGYNIKEARLMTYEEATLLGCDYEKYNCQLAPSWVISNSYWLGTAKDDQNIYYIVGAGEESLLYSGPSNLDYLFGIRPVIVLNKE